MGTVSMKSLRLLQVLGALYVRADSARDSDTFSGEGTDDEILPKGYFQKLVNHAKELGRAQLHASPNSTTDGQLDDKDQVNEAIPIASPRSATTGKSDDIISRISDIEDNLMMLRKGIGPGFEPEFLVPSTTTTTFSRTSKNTENILTSTIKTALEKPEEIEEKLETDPSKNFRKRYSKRPKFTKQQLQNFRKKFGTNKKSNVVTKHLKIP